MSVKDQMREDVRRVLFEMSPPARNVDAALKNPDIKKFRYPWAHDLRERAVRLGKENDLKRTYKADDIPDSILEEELKNYLAVSTMAGET